MIVIESRQELMEIIEQAVSNALDKRATSEEPMTINQVALRMNRHPQTVRRWAKGLTPVHAKGAKMYYFSQFKNHEHGNRDSADEGRSLGSPNFKAHRR